MALIPKRASTSRPSGEWSDDDYDYDVLADGVVVGRIMQAAAAPVGMPWLWAILAFEHREDRTSTHGYQPTREAAIAAFARSWRRGRRGGSPTRA
jgi:ADP-ribosylglycohydrolase